MAIIEVPVCELSASVGFILQNPPGINLELRVLIIHLHAKFMASEKNQSHNL